MPDDLVGDAPEMDFRFTAELWLHVGEGGWHFVTLPPALADEIEARQQGGRRGFGSVRITAVIGTTTWTTSLFPDSARQSYLLPVKRQVRTGENLADGDLVEVVVRLH